jgi:hypothetical protein
VCVHESHETTPDGYAVTICEEAFATPPFVRLPPDSQSDGVVYGGIQRDKGSESEIFAGRGTSLAISPDSAWLAEELSSGSVRYGYFLYRAEVSGSAVIDITPIARIDDRIFQRLIAGRILEGLASARGVDAMGEVHYAYDEKEVPIRIRLDEAPRDSEADRAQGFPRFALFGLVENANQAVRGADGRCLSSLRSLSDRNPLFSASDAGDQVTVLRHPDMHGILDDVFTMDWPAGTTDGNNMGAGLFVTTADLIQANSPTLVKASNSPHGVPWGGPSVDLDVVSGGGEACTP